jgi:hypothetical protein
VRVKIVAGLLLLWAIPALADHFAGTESEFPQSSPSLQAEALKRALRRGKISS